MTIVSCGKAPASDKEIKTFDLEKVTYKEFNEWMETHFKENKLTETVIVKFKNHQVRIEKGSTSEDTEQKLCSIG